MAICLERRVKRYSAAPIFDAIFYIDRHVTVAVDLCVVLAAIFVSVRVDDRTDVFVERVVGVDVVVPGLALRLLLDVGRLSPGDLLVPARDGRER